MGEFPFHKFQHCLVRGCEEEMISREKLRFKRVLRVHCPACESLAADAGVICPAEGNDGTSKRRGGLIAIGFDHLEIGADGRERELHQFVVLQNFGRDAVELFQLAHKFRVGQLMDVRMRIRELRRGARGNEKEIRLRESFSAQCSRKFKCDQPSHAVTEERERLIQQRANRLRKILHEGENVGERRLGVARTASWIVDSRPVERIGESIAHLCERGGSASRVWKEEDAHRRIWSWRWAGKPFIH